MSLAPMGCSELVDRLPAVLPKEFQVTFYHGDLTFENIIVDSFGEPCLIDPLDSYMPNYFADITKLCVELWGFWSFIFRDDIPNAGVYYALRNELLNSSLWSVYYPYMKVLVGIDLLRTLPYLHADPDKKHLIPDVVHMFDRVIHDPSG